MYEAKCLVMDYQQTNSVHQQHLHQLHSFAPAAAAAAADASSRWSQYQQLWRQHQMFINGMTRFLYPFVAFTNTQVVEYRATELLQFFSVGCRFIPF